VRCRAALRPTLHPARGACVRPRPCSALDVLERELQAFRSRLDELDLLPQRITALQRQLGAHSGGVCGGGGSRGGVCVWSALTQPAAHTQRRNRRRWR
jgi:hypothetical protein